MSFDFGGLKDLFYKIVTYQEITWPEDRLLTDNEGNPIIDITGVFIIYNE